MKNLFFSILLFISVNINAAEIKEIVSPFPPGGATSVFTRIVQQHLMDDLGSSYILIHKPGADGIIGTRYVANKHADSNTLITAGAGPFMTNLVMYNDLKYNYLDFDFVLPMASSPYVLVVSNKTKIQNLEEFIKAAQNGKLNCGTSFSGAAFLTKYLIKELKLNNLEIIPFKGSMEVITNLMGGNIDCSFDTMQAIIDFHKEGKVRIIAVASKEKHPKLPGVQLLKEVLPNGVFSTWYGMAMLKKSPDSEKGKLFSFFQNLQQNSRYREQLTALNLEIHVPEKDAQKFIETEYNRYEAIRRQLKIDKIDN